MSNSIPFQELTCAQCGSPLKTTDKPGATITCNCCGSAFLIPEPQGVTASRAVTDEQQSATTRPETHS